MNVCGFNGRKTKKRENEEKEIQPNRRWNRIHSVSQSTCVTLLEEKNRFIFLFSCINSWYLSSSSSPGAHYTPTSQIWLFFWKPTFIFISSTEQWGYVRKEISFVTVRCRVAFTRIIHNPSPWDSRGPVEGVWTGPVCHFYFPTLHLKEAHNKQ